MVSSLITNSSTLGRVATAFRGRKHDEAYKLVRRVNPDFWPVPTTQRHDENGKVIAMDEVKDGFLRESEYLPTWGRLSEWLHARSPFDLMPPPEGGVQLGRETISRLITLLNHHNVALLGRSQLLVCMMNEAVSGQVHVYGFVTVEADDS